MNLQSAVGHKIMFHLSIFCKRSWRVMIYTILFRPLWQYVQCELSPGMDTNTVINILICYLGLYNIIATVAAPEWWFSSRFLANSQLFCLPFAFQWCMYTSLHMQCNFCFWQRLLQCHLPAAAVSTVSWHDKWGLTTNKQTCRRQKT